MTAVQWFGAVVMVLAGIKLVVVLVADTVAIVKQALKIGTNPGLAPLGFSEILKRLPERYLTSIVAFLFGLLLYDAIAFGAIWGPAAK